MITVWLYGNHMDAYGNFMAVYGNRMATVLIMYGHIATHCLKWSLLRDAETYSSVATSHPRPGGGCRHTTGLVGDIPEPGTGWECHFPQPTTEQLPGQA
jgi:hypothetical protein